MPQIYAKKRWARGGIRGNVPAEPAAGGAGGEQTGDALPAWGWGGLQKDFLQKKIDSFRVAHHQDMAGFWNDMRRMGEANG